MGLGVGGWVIADWSLLGGGFRELGGSSAGISNTDAGLAQQTGIFTLTKSNHPATFTFCLSRD